MTAPFAVRTSPHFDRLLKRLARPHPEVPEVFARVIGILAFDPHNRSRTHDIRKLQGVSAGEGQYRLRIGRWRFRYDISGQEVHLHHCGLRRENTYRRRGRQQ
jgi:mRNA-degrading endonuclease RelE of RelBE toxin-antitoxin system